MKKRFYLYKSGSLLRQDNSLVLVKDDDKIYIPIEQVDIIFVFNHITINKNTISLLNDYKITIHFFSYYGNYLGGFYPVYPIKGDDLLKHVNAIQNINHKFRIAKEIIVSSVSNMLAVLKYYRKKGRQLGHLIDDITILKEELLKNINDDTNLMIYEARIKQIYYSAFNIITLNPYFNFTNRSNHPPKDPINALMSYGYAILYGVIRSVLYRSRLQIGLPFIHGTSRSPEGLQYDIADVFKPVLVDRLIFRLVNKGQLNETHFRKHNNGIYLSKEGSLLFIEEFENLLQTTVKDPSNNRQLSYRSIISREVHKITNDVHLKENYKGYRMKW